MKNKVKRGGGTTTLQGIDIKDIASFSPSIIPDLVLWIKANPNSFKYEEIVAYAEGQLPLVRLHLLQTFSSNLHDKVITEITSDTPDKPNGLIRMEYQSKMCTRFPTFLSGAIDLTNYVDPTTGLENTITLVTKTPINLPTNFSFFETSQGLSLKYFDSVDNLTITANKMVTSPTTTLDPSGQSHIVPTATLEELIVFSRKLSAQEEQQIEGYLAYKKNRQFTLPNDHPYLPDMATDPILINPFAKLNNLYSTIKAILVQQDVSIKTYLAKVGSDDLAKQDPQIRGILVDSLSDISVLKSIFNRGYLYARSTTGVTDINSVYTGINALSMYTVPMNSAQMDAEIADLTANLQIGIDFVKKLSEVDKQVIENNFAVNEAAIANSQKEAETDEGLHLIQYQVRRREIVQAQRYIQSEISDLGKRLLEVFYKEYSDKLDSIQEAFDYNLAKRKKVLETFMDIFRGLQASIKSDAWLQDMSKFTTIEYDTATSKYKDPTIQQLHDKFIAIQNEVEKGDIQYLIYTLDLMFQQTSSIITHWKPMKKYALISNLYTVHLHEFVYLASRLETDLENLIEKLTNIITAFSGEIANFKRYETVAIRDPGLGIHYYLPLPIIYFSRIIPADSTVLKFTHVITDEIGIVIRKPNSSGELDLQFFQPEVQGWKPHPTEAATYIRQTTYADTSGNTVNQIFKETPLQQESILGKLPAERLHKPYQYTLDGSFYEVPRTSVNQILQLQTSTIQEPILLPKYSVRAKSFYFIQNVGNLHFCVRNPGAIDDVIDCLGPGEIGIYLYGEGSSLSSTPGFAYGKLEWLNGMLPYDTIADSPRSGVATMVPELKTLIYLVPDSTTKPLLDKDGYYIQVQKAPDGNIYDPDDFSHSNPYAVRILPDTPLASLEPGPKGRVKPITNEIGMAKESTTGLGILCSVEGIPAVDEFGICKIAATHLLFMDGNIKIKGAISDLIVKGFLKDRLVRQLYNFETGLNFDEIFRSRFCRPMHVDTVKSPIFVTSHGLQICGPSGTFIYVPGTAKQEQTLITYLDSNGIKQAFLIQEDKPVEKGVAELIPYVNLKEVIMQMAGVLKAKQVLYRYASSIEYIEGLLKGIDLDSHMIAKLGDKIVATFESRVLDTKMMIQKNLDGFSEIQSSMLALNAAIQKNVIPNDVQISVGIIDIQIRDKLQAINAVYDPLQDTLEFYKGIAQKITDLSGFIIRLKNDGTDVIQKGYDSLHAIDTINIQENKTLSLPEINAIKLLLKEKDTEFTTSQTDLEKRITEQPEYLSDLRDWILDLQMDTGKQFNRLEEVRRLVTIRLAHDILHIEEKNHRNALNDLDTLKADIDLQKRDFARYESLFNASSTAPIPQDATKIPNEQGPFIYLANPSVERDLRPLSSILTIDDLKARWTNLLVEFDTLKSSLISAQTALAATTLIIPPAAARREDLVAATKTGQTVVDSHAKIITDFKTACVGPFQTFNTLIKEVLQNYKDTLKGGLAELDTAAGKIGDQRLAIETILKMRPNDSVQTALDAVGSEKASDIVFKVRAVVEPILSATTPEVLFPLNAIYINTPIKHLQHIQTSLQSISTESI